MGNRNYMGSFTFTRYAMFIVQTRYICRCCRYPPFCFTFQQFLNVRHLVLDGIRQVRIIPRRNLSYFK